MIEDFFEGVAAAMTVCDTEGKVIYQNELSVKSFGDARGANLQGCHQQASWQMIQQMLTNGSSNTYTVEKKGVKKLIHQTPWYKDGKVAGLVEYSIVLPDNLPHIVRE